MNGLSLWQNTADDALPTVPKKTIGNLSFLAFYIIALGHSHQCIQVNADGLSSV